ncbi:MAG: helix-turn-helix domain-containing protein [Enterocloster asparagiformis]|nr:helix-turn-helix domain-containing protein [Enterocloster asparagiformis]
MSEDKIRKIFSKNLTNQLALHGKNQKDLVDFIHVSSSTVSNWCTGQKLPRMDKIQAIAGWLGINTSDLLEEKSNNSAFAKTDVKEILYGLIDKIDTKDSSLIFDGSDPLSDADLEILRDELEMAIHRLKIFTRNKKAD